ncbi:protein of unknown function [Paraburkholderia dioscoreae]|uniref:Uncharacterized protein n=1 Tax=Paraburkholderia dioscoreae TaxID=2604047 RepID=A0A5Q4ZS42_9BURK|nr:protein of unknown function [Paraburkholderia dioscoreae]
MPDKPVPSFGTSRWSPAAEQGPVNPMRRGTHLSTEIVLKPVDKFLPTALNLRHKALRAT